MSESIHLFNLVFFIYILFSSDIYIFLNVVVGLLLGQLHPNVHDVGPEVFPGLADEAAVLVVLMMADVPALLAMRIYLHYLQLDFFLMCFPLSGTELNFDCFLLSETELNFDWFPFQETGV